MASGGVSEREGGRCWKVKASRGSHDCINPIRQLEETTFRDALDNRRTDIEFIKLSLGMLLWVGR